MRGRLFALVLLFLPASARGEELVLRLLRAEVQKRLVGEVRVGAISGDLPKHFTLHDVELDDAEGKPAIRIAELEVELSVLSLVRQHITIEKLRVGGLQVRARLLRDGRLNLAALANPSEGPSEKRTEKTVELQQVIADGVVNWLGAPVRLHVEGGVSLQPNGPVLSGSVIEVATPELGRLTGDERLIGEWRARLLCAGPMSRLSVEAELTPPRGRVSAHARFDVDAKRWSFDLDGTQLDPAAMLRGAPAAAISLSAHGQGRGARGSLEIRRLVAEAQGARAEIAGRVELPRDADLTVHVEARDLARLQLPELRGALSADAHVIHRARHTRVDLDLRGSALAFGPLRVAQISARAHTVDWQGQVRLDARGLKSPQLDFDSLSARVDGTSSSLRLSVDGSGPLARIALAAHGRPLGRGTMPEGAALVIDRLSAQIRDVAVRATGPARVRLGSIVSVDQLALASDNQRLTLSGRWDRARDRVRAQLAGQRLDLSSLGHLLWPNRRLPQTDASLTVALSGTRRAPEITLELDGKTLAHHERLWLDEKHLRVRARYARERVNGELELTAFEQRLHSRFDVPTSLEGARPISLEIAGKSDGLDRLRKYLPARFATLAGRARLDAHLSGTTRQPQIEVALDGEDLAFENLQKSQLHARLNYRDARLAGELAADLVGHHPAGTLRATLEVPIDLAKRSRLFARLEHTAPIDLRVLVNGLLVQELPLEQLGVRSPLKSGELSGSVAVIGTLHEPDLHAVLTAHRLSIGALHRVDANLRADYVDGNARVTLVGDVAGQPLLFARARTTLPFREILDGEPWKSAAIEVDAEVPAYEVAGGTISAYAKVRGSFAQPKAELTAQARRLQIGGTAISHARLSCSFDGQRARASVFADQPLGGELRIEATLPLRADAPANATLIANRVRLALPSVGALKKLEGRIDANLSMNGTRHAPIFRGQAHLADGVLALVEDPRLYKEVTLDLSADGSIITVERLALSADGGKLLAHGALELRGMSLSRVALEARAERLPVAQGPVGAWVDANLKLEGARASDDSFSGTLTLESGTAHLPKLQAGRKLQPVGPLAEVKFTDKKGERERARRLAAERNEVPTRATVTAHIPGPFHIRSSELMTDLDGELQIGVIGPLARVTGSISANGGWIQLLGRRYDLDRVRIGFSGTTPIDPELDIRITRETTDAVIAIEVQGTAKKPSVHFSSDPPIYDEPQIIGIIVSGDPSRSQVSDRSLDQKVVGALSSVIIGKLKDQVAPILPIDVLRVETGDSGYTGLTSTRVEVGKYITESVYVSYVHQFGVLQIGTRRLNANEANVEWRFKRRFEIDTMFGDAGAGSLDFFWTFRY